MIENYLFIGVGGFIKNELVKRFRERYQPSKVYGVLVDDFQNGVNYFDKIYNFFDMVMGYYNDEITTSINYKTLDDDIIALMQPYAAEILQMIGRMGIDNFDERMFFYIRQLEYWYNMIKINDIQCVIIAAPPHEVFDYMVYQFCQIYQIKICIMADCNLPYRICPISNLSDWNKNILNVYNKYRVDYKETDLKDIFLEETTEQYFQNMISLQGSQMRPWYVTMSPRKDEIKKRYFFPSWEIFINECKKNMRGRNTDSKMGVRIKAIPRFLLAVYWLSSRYFYGIRTTKKLLKHYNKLSKPVNLNEKFIYFPLHYQPECTSSPLGGGIYTEQLIPIKIIAANLPAGYKVFVKEHPAQSSFGRSIKLYDELYRTKNVVFVPSKTDGYELMKNAVAVAGLTGTSGWECQFYNKPFLMFGNFSTRYAPLTYTVRTNRDCKLAIESILKHEKTVTSKDLKLFVKATHDCTMMPGQDIDYIIDKIASVIEI